MADILDGDLGFFWPQRSNRISVDEEPARGYLCVDNEGVLTLRALEEDPGSKFFRSSEDRREIPHSIVGITETTGVIMSNIFRTRSSLVMGSQASLNLFSARVLIAGIRPKHLKSTRFNNVEVFFPGMSRWFGVTTSTMRTETDKSGLVKKASVEVESLKPYKIEPREGIKVLFSSHWSIRGQEDSRTIFSPVSVAVNSRKHREPTELLQIVFTVQDLFNCAYEKFVVADGGKIKPPPRHFNGSHYKLWASPLMVPPAHSRTSKSNTYDDPLFLLSQVGGPAAITKWIDLAQDHSRLIGPIVDPYRTGKRSKEMRMLEVGASIEYWFGYNRKQGRQWAKAANFQPSAIINSLPPGFDHIVGDTKKWAERFWACYTALKHYIPTVDLDPYEIEVLSQSGRMLILLVALNEISSRSAIVSEVSSSHRLAGLKGQIKDLLT